MNGYDEGYSMGQYRRECSDYDPRWDFADAAKAVKAKSLVGSSAQWAGTFAEFKRGFEDGFENKEPAP